VEDPVWADIRVLEGSPGGALPQEDIRGSGVVFENEREWRGMPGCSYWPTLCDVDTQPGIKVSDVGTFGGKRSN
jgi:hypothetical protein